VLEIIESYQGCLSPSFFLYIDKNNCVNSCLPAIFFVYLSIKIKVMTYQDKVKASKTILDLIKQLKKDESVELSYGKDRNGKPKIFKIRAYSDYKDEMSYSIWNSFSGMNIDKIGKTTMRGYTYDMMSQKTTYTFNLYQFNKVDQYEVV